VRAPYRVTVAKLWALYKRRAYALICVNPVKMVSSGALKPPLQVEFVALGASRVSLRRASSLRGTHLVVSLDSDSTRA
jgi:hypothetical protein